MDISQALLRLKSAEPGERRSALESIREAWEKGEDISAAEGAMKGMLADKDADVRAKAARVLVYHYGKGKAWGEIDALLGHPRSEVRESALYALEGFAGNFSLAGIPGLLKALDDNSFEVRAGAAAVFEKAAARGADISPAVPALKRAAIYGDERTKEKVGNALKSVEMRKEPGKCAYCLDCEAGLAPGSESGKFGDIATLIKSISCCGGDVTFKVFACSGCGKRYLSTFFDHSDSDGQFSVFLISAEDADAIARVFGKCPNPEWRMCKCEIHMGYLKDEKVPVKGTLKYSYR